MMEFRSAEYTADGLIKAEINHPRFGWIPHTASPNDAATSGLFETMEASGDVAAYVAPEEPTAEEKLEAARDVAETDRVTFLLGMVGLGVITEATALEASDGTWPAAFNTFLAALPLAEKMAVKSAWRGADRVRYRSTVLATIAAWTQTEEAVVAVTQSDLDAVFGVTA